MEAIKFYGKVNGGKLEGKDLSRFEGKEVEVIVLPIDEIDETEYLLSSETNKKILLDSINDIKNNHNLVKVDLAKLKNGELPGL